MAAKSEDKSGFSKEETPEKIAKTDEQYADRTGVADKSQEELVKEAEEESLKNNPVPLEEVTTARDDGGSTHAATSEALTSGGVEASTGDDSAT